MRAELWCRICTPGPKGQLARFRNSMQCGLLEGLTGRKRLGVAEVLVHNTPQEQLDEWKETPGTAAHDDGHMPHGGICHLFLLKIK